MHSIFGKIFRYAKLFFFSDFVAKDTNKLCKKKFERAQNLHCDRLIHVDFWFLNLRLYVTDLGHKFIDIFAVFLSNFVSLAKCILFENYSLKRVTSFLIAQKDLSSPLFWFFNKEKFFFYFISKHFSDFPYCLLSILQKFTDFFFRGKDLFYSILITIFFCLKKGKWTWCYFYLSPKSFFLKKKLISRVHNLYLWKH